MKSDDVAKKAAPAAHGQASGVAATNVPLRTSPDQPLDLVEVSGFIKWFDAAKGYGFIMPDNGTQDVLL
ncbi:MAG: cold-shock protein, partial [Beijerinckiaceae bacterium]